MLPVTQNSTGVITASGLELLGAGTFTLDNANNDIATLASNTTGSLTFRDVDDFTVGTVNSTRRIQTPGNVTLTAGTNINIIAGVDAGPTEAIGPSNIVTLTAGQDIILGTQPFTNQYGDITASQIILNADRDITVQNTTWLTATGANGFQATAGGNFNVIRPSQTGARVRTTAANAPLTITTGTSGILTLDSNLTGMVQANGGAITLNTNQLDLLSGTVVSSNGQLIIQPVTNSTTIGIGNGATGTLNLDTSEIGRLANGFSQITIGSAMGSGNVDIRTTAFRDNLLIRTPTGAGSINLNGALSTGSGTQAGSITLQAGQDITGNSGSSITTIDQNVLLDAGRSITLTTANISTGNGNITLNANQGATPTSGNFNGINLQAANLTTTGGNINLAGRGGNTGSSNNGIRQIWGSKVTSSSGNITYVGTGGTVGADSGNNRGILFANYDANTTTLIESNSGQISLTGVGGTGSNGSNHGIIHDSATDALTSNAITRTTTGNIIYSGTSGTGGNDNYGVYLTGRGATVTSTSGTINLTGHSQATGGTNNFGIRQQWGGQVISGGNISLTGTSANNNEGIFTAGGTPSSGGFLQAVIQGTGNNSITLTADRMNLDLMQLQSTGNGTLLIQPNDPATSIGIGTGASGTLLFSNTALSKIEDGFSLITIGRDNSSGNIDIRTAAFKDNLLIRTPTGTGTINLNGALSTGAGTQAGSITLQAGQDITGNSGSSITTQNQVIVLNSDRDATNGGAISLTGTTITSNGGNITLGGGANPATTAAIGSSTTSTYRSGIRLDGANLTAGGGNISLRGQGFSSDISNNGIFQHNASQVTTSGNGTITYVGTGGSGTNENLGIRLQGADTLIRSGNGTISLTGNGSGSGNGNYGIWQLEGALVATGEGTLTALTGGGNITYVGNGGANGANANYGIFLSDSNTAIRSGNGTIQLTGTGGGNNASGNPGIVQANGAQVLSGQGNLTTLTGGGNIIYTGLGSANGTSFNHGILLIDSNTAIRSGAGSIQLTGTGRGYDEKNYGIVQADGARVITGEGNLTALTGGSNITYIGNGGGIVTGGSIDNSDNYGIWLTGTNTSITSGNGTISLTGTGGGDGTGSNNYGILQGNGTQVTTSTGNISYTGTGSHNADAIRTETGSNLIGNGTTGTITLTGDRMRLNNLTIQTTGTATLQPQTNNQLIDLGGTDAAGTLGLSQTELDQFTANTLRVGNANAGDINFSSAITLDPAKVPTLSLITGGTISQAAPLNVQGLAVTSKGDVTLDNTTNQIQTLAAGTTGNLNVVTSTDLTVDTLNPTGIENSNNVILQSTTGNITLNQPINATNDITLAAEQNFININNVGVTAFTAGGRWLVYATSPAGNVNGWSVLGGSQQFSTSYPTPPGFGGNGFIYTVAAPLVPVQPSQTSAIIATTITPIVTSPGVSPPVTPSQPLPVNNPSPAIGLPPANLPLPPNFSTVLQGEEEENLPIEKTLCQLVEGDDSPLEVDGVPVESSLAEQCR